MRSTSLLSTLLAAAAMSGAAISVSPFASGLGTLTVSESTGNSVQTNAVGQQAPGDTKSDRLGTGAWMRRNRARSGKRYSASIRQHQRHAAKARNQRKARAANRA